MRAALLLALCLTTGPLPAAAGLDRRDGPCHDLLPVPRVAEIAVLRTGGLRLSVTTKTDVRLDGQPCRLDDLPDGITMVLLNVTADGTVRAVHFRSKTKP